MEELFTVFKTLNVPITNEYYKLSLIFEYPRIHIPSFNEISDDIDIAKSPLCLKSFYCHVFLNIVKHRCHRVS